MSCAIAFRQRGIAADLIDIDPEWRAIGAGLTITGPTLRAFRALGVLPAIAAEGYLSWEAKFLKADGTFIQAMAAPSLGEGLAPAGGILRPALHRIMSRRVRDLKTDVRLGVQVKTLSQDAEGVTVLTSDGDERRYEVVVGADGFLSSTRRLLFPDAPQPSFTGQGCWRVLAPRPDHLVGAEIYFGPEFKCGVNPCAPDRLYLFANVQAHGNPFISPEDQLGQLHALLAPFGRTIAEVRDGLNEDSEVNYRPLETLLLPTPWHRGRVGLIGDTVHATTPHLASGAGMAVEDGLLLPELLEAAPTVEEGWQSFEARRWERCRLVVENSLQISRWELQRGHDADIARLMVDSTTALAKPI